jgi:hypothetical protein
MFWSCKHKWELLERTTTQSQLEHSLEVARRATGDPIQLPPNLCCTKRKVIEVFTCEKCGKLERFVENI